MRHPPTQPLGRHVDEFDLIGAAHHLVGDGLPLRHIGDPLDDVVEGFQVLDVDGGDDIDAGGEDLLDVLPALGVPSAGHVGVSEFVDECHLRASAQQSVEVQLAELRAPVEVCGRGKDLQALEPLLGERPLVAFHGGSYDVDAPPCSAVCLVDHPVGLADTGGRPEEDLEPAPSHSRFRHGTRLLPPDARLVTKAFLCGRATGAADQDRP